MKVMMFIMIISIFFISCKEENNHKINANERDVALDVKEDNSLYYNDLESINLLQCFEYLSKEFNFEELNNLSIGNQINNLDQAYLLENGSLFTLNLSTYLDYYNPSLVGKKMHDYLILRFNPSKNKYYNFDKHVFVFNEEKKGFYIEKDNYNCPFLTSFVSFQDTQLQIEYALIFFGKPHGACDNWSNSNNLITALKIGYQKDQSIGYVMDFLKKGTECTYLGLHNISMISDDMKYLDTLMTYPIGKFEYAAWSDNNQYPTCYIDTLFFNGIWNLMEGRNFGGGGGSN